MDDSKIQRSVTIRFWVRLLAPVLLIALIGGAAWWTWEKTLPAREVKKAKAALRAEDYLGAALHLRRALDKAPGNVEAIEAMAELSLRSGTPDALSWWREVVRLRPDVLNSHAGLIEAALRSHQLPVARAALEGTPQHLRDSAEYHGLAGNVAVAKRDFPSAEKHFKEAVRLDPASPAHRLDLAAFKLLPGSSEDDRKSAVEELEKLTSDLTIGADALRNLIAAFQIGKAREQAQAVAMRLVQHMRASFDDRLLALEILSDPEVPEFATLQEKLSGFAKERPEFAARYIEWLTARQNAAEARDWASTLPEEIRNDTSVRMAVSAMHVSLRDWQALKKSAEEPWSGVEMFRSAYLARAERELGNDDLARLKWKLALQQASGSSVNLNALGSLLETWGWREEQREILWRAVSTGAFPEAALRQLAEEYTAQRNSSELHRTYAKWLEINPRDVAVRNNYAMCSILLRRDLERALQTTTELVKELPGSPEILSTHLHALRAANRSKSALELLKGQPAGVQENPSIQPIRALLLSDVGDPSACTVLKEVPTTEGMLPEEVQMLSQARAKCGD